MSRRGRSSSTPEGAQERKLAVPPLGPAYLAASLRRAGYDVEIIDVLITGYDNERLVSNGAGRVIRYGLDEADVARRIAVAAPDLIGVSCLFSNRGREALELCRLAKDVLPHVPVVLGGQHPSGMPALVTNPAVDFILYGEADEPMVALCDALRRGGDLRDVPQIVLPDGEKFWRSPTVIYPDVNALPWPDWSSVDLPAYWDAGMADLEQAPVSGERNPRFAVMLTSRGCPHDCYYCTATLMGGRRYRKRAFADLIAEIHHMREPTGSRKCTSGTTTSSSTRSGSRRSSGPSPASAPASVSRCPPAPRSMPSTKRSST